MAVDYPVVVVAATGCMEVSTTVYPYSAWRMPYMHIAFENAGAGVSGIEAAYKVLRRKGKVDKEIKFVASAATAAHTTSASSRSPALSNAGTTSRTSATTTRAT